MDRPRHRGDGTPHCDQARRRRHHPDLLRPLVRRAAPRGQRVTDVPAASSVPMTNQALFERSCRVSPGGVNSSIRAFKAVGGTPYLVAHAEGPFVWDVEGTRYIDLVQSYGAIILGHAHPAVTAAVTQAARGSTSYGAPTPGEM